MITGGITNFGLSRSWLRDGGDDPPDPLAGILFVGRWQPHNFQPGTPQQTVTVAEAEFDEINGGYLLVADTWTTNNGATITYDAGTSIWTISNADQSGGYIGTGGDASNPATATQWFQTGIATDPEPVVTTQLSPLYLPFGLFQDAACTVPALNWGDPIGGWRDMFTAGNPVASQSNAMKRAALQFAPLASGIWIPEVKFNGVDALLVTDSVVLSASLEGSIFVTLIQMDSNGGIVVEQNGGTGGSNPSIEGNPIVGYWDAVLSASIGTCPTGVSLLAELIASGGTHQGFKNGVAAGSTNTNGACGTDVMAIGGRISGGQNRNFIATQVLVSLSALSVSNRQKVENYSAFFKPA